MRKGEGGGGGGALVQCTGGRGGGVEWGARVVGGWHLDIKALPVSPKRKK